MGKGTAVNGRESIENLWSRATPVAPLLDEYRAEVFAEAAAVLEEIARKQGCFDDADSAQNAEATYSCARALRVYIAAVQPEATR
jgi:hypothetical protein